MPLKPLVVLFCFFSATGSFPVDFFGAKLSNVYTLAFCAVMPLFLLQRTRWTPLGLVALFFCAWQISSALWASEIGFGLYRALVVSGYVFLALALPTAATRHSVDLIGIYGRVGVLAAMLLIACYVAFLPLGARAVYPQLFIPSMSLQPLDDFDLNDPNIVACALSVALICTMMRSTATWRQVALVIYILAILLTQSRTALFFLPVAGLVAAVLTKDLRAMRNALLALVVVVGVAGLLMSLLGRSDDLSELSGALADRFSSESASNDDRLERLDNALDELARPIVALFGLGAGGAMASGLEPHNMFLSFFLELGVFGFGLFCAIFLLIGRMVWQIENPHDRFYLAWLLLFIFFACLTYWHTRTLWFSLSLIVFGWQQRRLLHPPGRIASRPRHAPLLTGRAG